MSQIGAIFYVAWGLLHLYAAFQIYKLGKRQLAGMVHGRIYQSVWNLAAVAVAVIAWPSSTTGSTTPWGTGSISP
jgi:hypothetical protein